MPRRQMFRLDQSPILTATDEPEDFSAEEAQEEGLLVDEVPADKPRKAVEDDVPWWRSFYRPAILLKRDDAGRQRWYYRGRVYTEVPLHETSESESELFLDLDRRPAA